MSYEFEHSVKCPVSRDFAWQFWSNVENWAAVDPGVESVKLDGEFAAGTKGLTKPRGAPETEWQLLEVEDGQSVVVGVFVPGAVWKFVWLFEDSNDESTIITQRMVLEGERADDYAEAVAMFKKGIPDGMQSLVRGIVSAGERAD
jgi:hypothetical protein